MDPKKEHKASDVKEEKHEGASTSVPPPPPPPPPSSDPPHELVQVRLVPSAAGSDIELTLSVVPGAPSTAVAGAQGLSGVQDGAQEMKVEVKEEEMGDVKEEQKEGGQEEEGAGEPAPAEQYVVLLGRASKREKVRGAGPVCFAGCGRSRLCGSVGWESLGCSWCGMQRCLHLLTPHCDR